MQADVITDLVRRAGAGDQQAWNAIVDEYAKLVWSTVRGFRFSEALRADAVQTTWLRLVEHLADIRDPACIAGWLVTTARRACIELQREAGRELCIDLRDEQLVPLTITMSVADGGPEGSAVRQEHRRLVRHALTELDDRDRTLLALLSAPDVSYRQISAQLEMPVGSIGPTRARALAKLRRALDTVGVRDAQL